MAKAEVSVMDATDKFTQHQLPAPFSYTFLYYRVWKTETYISGISMQLRFQKLFRFC